MKLLLAAFLLTVSLLAVAQEDNYQTGVLIISATDASGNDTWWLSEKIPNVSHTGYQFVDFCTDEPVVLSSSTHTNIKIRATDINEAGIMCSEG